MHTGGSAQVNSETSDTTMVKPETTQQVFLATRETLAPPCPPEYTLRVEALFEVVSESPDLLVINKPAGLVCHPTKGDALSSLISRVRLHLGELSHPQLIN